MHYAIGVDVGGTKIECALVNEKGRILQSKQVPTPTTYPAFLTVIRGLITEMKTRPIKGIGIGSPGLIINGVVHGCENLPFLKNKPLLKDLKGMGPITLENDANCFTLGEWRWGAGKNAQHLVGLVVGTGIGAGIIVNGKLFPGASSGAGELGKITFAFEDFDVESLLAGPGILRRYFEHGGTDTTMSTAKLFHSKDAVARKTVADTHELMGWLLGLLMRAYNPQVIVIGGGVANAPFYPQIKQAAKKYVHIKHFTACKIVKNRLGENSGVIGAASLVL